MASRGSAQSTLNEPQQLLMHEHSYLARNSVRQTLRILLKWHRQWATAD